MMYWVNRVLVLLVLAFVIPTVLYAKDKEKVQLFHTIAREVVLVQPKHDVFLRLIEAQMPKNAELLDLYIPKTFKTTLERGHFDQITHLVYLYALPEKLHINAALRKQQFQHMKAALEYAYSAYVTMPPPNNPLQKTWKQRIYTHMGNKSSVYFLFSKKGMYPKYSVILNFSLGKKRVLPVALSTYVFMHDRKVYFLTATATMTTSNYQKEVEWTRDIIHEFALAFLELPENERVPVPTK